MSIHNNVVVVVVCEHGVSPAFEDPVPCLKVDKKLMSSFPPNSLPHSPSVLTNLIITFRSRPSSFKDIEMHLGKEFNLLRHSRNDPGDFKIRKVKFLSPKL